MSIDIFFAGDVVLAQKRNGRLIQKELQQIISRCDVACCNFEAPITYNGQKKQEKIGPSLSQPSETVEQLKEGGFNLFSLANNHIMDYGKEGLAYTLEILDSFKIDHIGANVDATKLYTPFVYEKNGVSLGIVSVSEMGFGASIQLNSVGYAWFGSGEFFDTLKVLLDKCDHVIVVCHGGAEKWDAPLPEYRELYRNWIELGVSAVIAHHPHVAQGYERYKDGYIFYSLGNFAFDKGKGIQNPSTICVLISLTKDEILAKPILTRFAVEGVEVIKQDNDFVKYVQRCVELLENPEYMNYINRMCVDFYMKQYKGYYEGVLNIYKGSFKRFLKTLLLRYIKKQRFSELWLYHNLEIESHYWICRRALDIIRNGVRN